MARLTRFGQIVYFARPVGANGPVKIGCSVYPEHRVKQFALWSPIDLEIAATIPGNEIVEARFHRMFLDSHFRLEWFHWTPELEAAITAINARTFRLSNLPRYAGVLSGMRRRIATFEEIDYDYLDARKEYDQRDYKISGFYRGAHPAPGNFALIRDAAEKQRIFQGLRSWLDAEPTLRAAA